MGNSGSTATGAAVIASRLQLPTPAQIDAAIARQRCTGDGDRGPRPGRKRGGPLTIPLCNRVFDFAAESAAEAVLVLGLVCQQWREAESHFCADMWRRLKLARWGAAVRGKSFSHWAYERRARTGLRRARAPEMDEVENCGAEAADFAGPRELRFVCPFVSSQFRRLPDVDGATGLPVFFCNVCEKRVYAVDTPQQLAAKRAQGACVSISAGAAQMMREVAAASLGTGHQCTHHHIAIATTEPAPTPRGEQPSGLTGVAELVLATIANEITGRQPPNATAVLSVLSSESLIWQWDAENLVHFHVVRLPPPPADLDASSATTGKYARLNPALAGNALGRDPMPLSGGWSFVAAVTVGAQRWLDLPLVPKATPLRALISGNAVAGRARLPEVEALTVAAERENSPQRASALLRICAPQVVLLALNAVEEYITSRVYQEIDGGEG
jgi:hypothetical protein